MRLVVRLRTAGTRNYLREFVDFFTIARRSQLTSDEIVEDVDKLSKHNVHERQHAPRSNHADEGDAVHEPAETVIVGKYALYT